MTIPEHCRRCGRKIIIVEGGVPACDECRKLTSVSDWLPKDQVPPYQLEETFGPARTD